MRCLLPVGHTVTKVYPTVNTARTVVGPMGNARNVVGKPARLPGSVITMVYAVLVGTIGTSTTLLWEHRKQIKLATATKLSLIHI